MCFTHYSGVAIDNFDQVNAGRVSPGDIICFDFIIDFKSFEVSQCDGKEFKRVFTQI